MTSGNFSILGLVGSEGFTVTQPSGTYNSKDVATAATVTASLSADNFTPGPGTRLSDYTLPSTASGPGHITPAPLTVTATAENKVYDGDTRAVVHLAGRPRRFSRSVLQEWVRKGCPANGRRR